MKVHGKGILVAGLIAVVAAAVVGGLLLLGPPAQERMRRLDARRVDALRALAASVDLYWTRQGRLPESLEQLSRESGFRAPLLDPETGKPYGYRVLDGRRYELCAEFARDVRDETGLPARDFWAHGSGPWCFQLAAREIRRD